MDSPSPPSSPGGSPPPGFLEEDMEDIEDFGDGIQEVDLGLGLLGRNVSLEERRLQCIAALADAPRALFDGSNAVGVNGSENGSGVQGQQQEKARGSRQRDSDDDDSDMEDPNYLREMCSSFLGKIKEKTEIINSYKKVLFNAQLQLVKREAAHQRQIRRLFLGNKINNLMKKKGEGRDNYAVAKGGGARVRFENGEGGSGRDAVLILPEEIWVMILENVPDVKDLRSCSKVCQLFEGVLEQSKPQWLFATIFPFIFNFLRRKDILNCRRVCKKWRGGADNFLEQYYSIIAPDKPNDLEPSAPSTRDPNMELPNGTLKTFHFEYNFSIPPPPPEDLESSSSDSDSASTNSSQQSINRNHDKVREAMKPHPKNPFIGRSVTIEEDSADFDHLEGQDPGNRTFLSQAKIFLQDFGVHIWHLSICCNMQMQSPSDFYQVCLRSLIECKNLRSLCLGADLLWSLRRHGDISRINRCRPPVDCKYLDSLQVDVDNKNIFIVQDKLVGKYSNQLRRLEVQIWNTGLYPSFHWPVLRELQVNKGSADETLDSLKRLTAPNLRKLAIRLDGRGPYLQTLLELTNQFPKLDHLEIKFQSRFGGISEDEIMSLPPGLTSSSALTTLELTSSVTDILSYNFLLYFPFLQRLMIRHGHWTSYNLLDATAPYFNHLQRASAKNITNKEIVKIAKFILQDAAGGREAANTKLMYKSNVWGMLPFLQVFELCNARFVPEKKKVYTRQGYEYYRVHGNC